MKKRTFPAHGKLKLSVEGQVLTIQGVGPANIEMVKQYHTQVIGLRKEIMHDPWVSLVLLSGTPLVTAEAKGMLSDTIRQAKQMGLHATAVVFVNIEHAEMIREFWRDIYLDSGVFHQFFETEQQARTWLQEILEAEQLNGPINHANGQR